ncbi:hypothetical protein A3C87_03300 [Candidatus Kaiserbacteria bacterium RIFCSPHIGHO2_02_FULL_49_34]|uniref:Uncharacterized protein n=1 Tax=Candidatus Kaiserbacteria bacterium RIFCSPHIGHO2_02_FULL_49_34 TaxID=1798491 RepID=A0A1F6DJF6_9BACT|nr:MAG: hypothetical protein A3C87_03300 [Candidatus Kaiserbacteria bacterium RIFCSPHIGHO2_02_FULL_49_34]
MRLYVLIGFALVFLAAALVEFLLWGRAFILKDAALLDMSHILFLFAMVIGIYVLHAVHSYKKRTACVFQVRFAAVLVLGPLLAGMIANIWWPNIALTIGTCASVLMFAPFFLELIVVKKDKDIGRSNPSSH